MTSTTTTCEFQSHSSNEQLSSRHSSHSECAIEIKSERSSSASSLSSLDNEIKNENLIGASLSSRPNNTEYFRKSNSLDSGYKTFSAASHGTSHTDPIDEENERQNSFLQIASSPSSCSSSSYVASNTNQSTAKHSSKIDFPVDDEDELDEKQSKLSRKDSKSNIDGKKKTFEHTRERKRLILFVLRDIHWRW